MSDNIRYHTQAGKDVAIRRHTDQIQAILEHIGRLGLEINALRRTAKTIIQELERKTSADVATEPGAAPDGHEILFVRDFAIKDFVEVTDTINWPHFQNALFTIIAIQDVTHPKVTRGPCFVLEKNNDHTMIIHVCDQRTLRYLGRFGQAPFSMDAGVREVNVAEKEKVDPRNPAFLRRIMD